ncbi:L-aspartate oxidase [Pseudoclavibacter endophyticus]|uniref:L-aspartate oxidase n=1 Tax=Pseudoclavibacter endophyticus TaxID=1778590 RepID=A0A6H9WS56_9MICO|nr:L-aspartate oxidase [Pseudoclavibacter endophyticus]
MDDRDPGPAVVIVGSGIAGLTAALGAASAGCRVTVATKASLDDGSTRFAQGGIAGVMFGDDRTDDHAHDTVVAGAGLSDRDAVHVLVEEGPDRIRDLIDAGVNFDRGDDGSYVKGLEAAHSYPRVLHAGGDATGLAIERALVARLREAEARGTVQVIEHAFLVDVILDASLPDSSSVQSPHHAARARGVELLVDGGRLALAADAVVLATGGAGHLFAHTTNPAVATGDGIAAAIRAGARVEDLEFVQFHPTSLPAAPALGVDAFLVSEAVRGEGATLVDETGRRFAFGAHPDGELAPRDIVARAIAERMAAQGGRPVRLDATRLGRGEPTAAFLARRFPTIDRVVRERGLDWSREPIPVTPAAHYLMGGVATDLHGRTSIPGLYAVGEVARTGVHGANRLASNSLLEGAVFGARAAAAIAAGAERQGRGAPLGPRPAGAGGARSRAVTPSAPAARQGPAGARPCGDAPRTDCPFSREALQRLMWNHAGLVRDADHLDDAARQIGAWRDEAAREGPSADDVLIREDANLLLVAAHLVDAALRRSGSIGAHFRSDDRRPARDATAAASMPLPDAAAALRRPRDPEAA